jgi:outer membrane protein TolC
MSNDSVNRAAAVLALGVWLTASDGVAQEPITMADAMNRARTATPAARALAEAGAEAAQRVRQARAGYFPKVDVTESLQRGNQPVFVFGSLLAQRRFSAASFALEALNRPSPLTNARTAIAVEQPIFDAGLTRRAVENAEVDRQIVAAAGASARQDHALDAARAFVDLLRLESQIGALAAGVEAAQSDLERARARRDVGLVTDADVLDVEIHLADVQQRQLAAAADLAVARYRLNEVMGTALDAPVAVVPPPAPPAAVPVDGLIREARMLRPDRRAADLLATLAANARRTAEAAFLPRVGVQGGWELNGQGVTDLRSSWMIGAQVQMNLFRGFGDAARVAEAGHAEARVRAERDGLERAIEVEIRAAHARLGAARAREQVGQATLAHARESQRIVRDRYDSGLATVGDVLRAASTVLDAESRATSAHMDVIVQAVALDRAVGRL